MSVRMAYRFFDLAGGFSDEDSRTVNAAAGFILRPSAERHRSDGRPWFEGRRMKWGCGVVGNVGGSYPSVHGSNPCGPTNVTILPSSNRLGHYPFKVVTRGSNPPGSTNVPVHHGVHEEVAGGAKITPQA